MTDIATRRRSAHATPAQLYLWIWGALLIVLGVGSLIVHPDFSLGSDVTGKHLFGVFDTNGWHGVLGLMSGLGALAFAPSDRWSTPAALVVGVGAGLIPAAVFFVVGSGGIAVGLVPVDLADGILLHLIPGFLGLAAAAATHRRAPLAA
jgi:hypothetical protein